MVLLIASIVALFLGPGLIGVGRRYPWVTSAVDVVIPIILLVFVFGEILPESVEHAGYWSLALLAAGMVIPSLFEHYFEERSTSSRLSLALAVAGLGTHAMLDGAAIAMDLADHHVGALGIGVVLHRVSDGVSVVWLSHGRLDRRGTWVALVFLGLATAVGYLAAPALIEALTSESAALCQAFFGGVLLHVTIAHSPTIARWSRAVFGRALHEHAPEDPHSHSHVPPK